jgi:hypothetical protein
MPKIYTCRTVFQFHLQQLLFCISNLQPMWWRSSSRRGGKQRQDMGRRCLQINEVMRACACACSCGCWWCASFEPARKSLRYACDYRSSSRGRRCCRRPPPQRVQPAVQAQPTHPPPPLLIRKHRSLGGLLRRSSCAHRCVNGRDGAAQLQHAQRRRAPLSLSPLRLIYTRFALCFFCRQPVTSLPSHLRHPCHAT